MQKIKRKLLSIAASVAALVLCLCLFASCSGATSTHQHVFAPVEGLEATCTTAGHRSYEKCIYCGAMRANGVEVTEEDVVIPIDENNHVHVENVDEVVATCIGTGMQAYRHCTDCDTYFTWGYDETTQEALVIPIDPDGHMNMVSVAAQGNCYDGGVMAHRKCNDCGTLFTMDGEETTLAELAIAPGGEHDWSGDDPSVCVNGDAWKILLEGQEEIVDFGNQIAIKQHSLGGVSSSASGDSNYKQYFFNTMFTTDIMTFHTQDADEAGVDENGGWTYQRSTGSTFTRFTIADETDPAKTYVGRFMLVFDFTPASNIDVTRLGAKIVDGAGNLGDWGSTQSPLLGTTESTALSLSRNQTYRFVYDMNLTSDSNQFIQFWSQIGSATATISNVHVIYLDGGATSGNPSSQLVWFGAAEDSAFTADRCTHEWAVDGHCPSCGRDLSA
mgnify:FL=1